MAKAPFKTTTIYFVDATGGSDSDDGKSPAAAWQTISKINSSSFNPNDRILFKRGEVWREQLTVNNSGTAGNPITFGAYDSGADPKITGTDLLTGWTLHSGSIYQMTYAESIDTYLLLEDGDHLTRVGSLGALTAAGQFFPDNAANTIYAWCTDDADPDTHTMEIGARYYAVVCDDRQYITFDSIHMHGSGGQFGAGFKLYPTFLTPQNITLTNCRISYCWQSGITLSHINGYTAIDSFLVDNCEIDHCGEFGMYLFGDDASHRFTNITIQDCHIHNNGLNTTVGQFGIFSSWSNGLVINGCTVHDNQGQFDWSGNIYLGNAINSEVSYNLVYNGTKNNIHLDTNCEGSTVHYNITYGAFWNGIWFEDHEIANGMSAIYNNTSFDNLHGIVLGPGGGTIQEVSGVTVKNNILFDNHRANVELNEDGGSADYLNNTWDNNCYLADSAHGDYEGEFRADSPRVNKTFAEWKTYISDDANSLGQDPLMRDPDNGDFHLQVNSQCRDAGADVGLTEDYAGVSVPQETNPAIGAYEYV